MRFRKSTGIRTSSAPTRNPRRRDGREGPWRDLKLWHKALLVLGLAAVLSGLGAFVYFYTHFARIIDAKLSGDIFNNASLVFAAPTEVLVGEAATPQNIAGRLRKAMYAEGDTGSNVGTYVLKGNHLAIRPGPASFFRGDLQREGAAVLEFLDGRVVSITDLDRLVPLQSYSLEPEEVTTLFDSERSKRRLLRYQDLPKQLVDAVVATEDSGFFSHFGVSIYRIFAAAVADIRADQRTQGGSTLTMQLARNVILNNRRRTFRRKAEEIFVALLLEQRLTKQQIFELYANMVYLGQRGSFSIYGFGEAASAYFNKDVGSLTLSESAFLAGLIRGPNLYLPYKHPERVLERRNYVLQRMVETGALKREVAEAAAALPLGLAKQNVEASQAPYFVDLVREDLLAQFSEDELLSQKYRIYTTLDLDLQRAASEGAVAGVADVDRLVKKRQWSKKVGVPGPDQPQLALIALDPHTGMIRALVGGRDYAASQLNHVVARRPPGSSFKPFVYAAALNSGVDGSLPLITPATTLMDDPTSFQFGDEVYEPEDYKQDYHGLVTVREALMLSLNVPTVRLAEMIGYSKVRSLAIEAGINKDIGSTPALALGAYVATPLEMSGAYTVFANGGVYVAPRTVLAVEDSTGRTIWASPTVTRPVLDPRVNYLMVSLLESVMNNGTAYPVRSRGFKAPAAGKTGTSHDGWFAGFTSNLLAIAWVGYDDDRELNLVGAASALPIWTEFMKRAIEVPAYSMPQPFNAPEGIETAAIDDQTNVTAGPGAASTHSEVFIAGTEPAMPSEVGLPTEGGDKSPAGGASGVLGRILHVVKPSAPTPAMASPPLPPGAPPPGGVGPQPEKTPPAADPEPKEKGVLKRLLSVFKGKGSKTPPSKDIPPAKNQDP